MANHPNRLTNVPPSKNPDFFNERSSSRSDGFDSKTEFFNDGGGQAVGGGIWGGGRGARVHVHRPHAQAGDGVYASQGQTAGWYQVGVGCYS